MNPPIVLIIGRPNVGKSTLYNRLVGRAAAVVFDRPGVTRDLLEAPLDVGDRPVRLIDTAGWPYPAAEDPELSAGTNREAGSALKSSGIVLWVVDGREGRTGAEDAFAQRILPYRNKTILVVNKLDELDRPAVQWADTEFAGLPWEEAVPISSKHGRGIADLISVVEAHLKKSGPSENEPPAGPQDDALGPLRLSILGRPNVGKSTLVNRILGADRVVVSDRPGTTRVAVEAAFTHRDRPIMLVDTAGVRRIDRITDGLERTISRIALRVSEAADVVLLVMDISQGLAEQDLRLLSHLWRRGVSAVAAANKWDLVPDRASGPARDLEVEFRERAHDAREAPFVRISAKTGHGVSTLLDTVLAVHETSRRDIRTPELNRRLQEWNTEMPTSLFRRGPGKLQYRLQTRTRPVAFKIFATEPKIFRGESIRCPEKRFREAFGLRGI